MNNFEKEYYESERFWEGEALQDEGNIKRIKETASLIPPDTTSLVDIGCGNGVFVNYLQKEIPNLNLFAIDRSKSALKYVKTENKEGDIADIPLPDNSFDCVTCLEVIEHLPVGVFQKALSELVRISNKYVIISATRSACPTSTTSRACRRRSRCSSSAARRPRARRSAA